jgi:hypothetical protein
MLLLLLMPVLLSLPGAKPVDVGIDPGNSCCWWWCCCCCIGLPAVLKGAAMDVLNLWLLKVLLLG